MKTHKKDRLEQIVTSGKTVGEIVQMLEEYINERKTANKTKRGSK